MKDNQIKILLIEDNPGDARLIEELLRRAQDFKFELKHVDRLAAGLEQIAQRDYDVILLDLMLPESTGMQTFDKVYAFSPGIPIVVLTGIANGNLGVTAIQEGAQDYLVKGEVDSRLLVKSLRYSIERRRSEDARIELQKKYEELVNSLPIGVFQHSLENEGSFLEVNPAMASIFEAKNKEDLLNCKVSEIYQDREYFYRIKTEALEDGFIKDRELPMITLKGRKFLASLTCVVRKDDSGGIFFDGIIEDITERKRIEQMKSDFVSLVSHQLKTPVAQINGYVNNMLSGITGPITPKQKDYLDDMRRISKNSYRLISDLLNISRLERGVVSVNLQPVPLKEIISQAVGEYSQAALEKGLTLEVNNPVEALMVMADKEKMAEAVANVIHNAVKFTREGSVTIIAGKQAGLGTVEVIDTGKGIPAEDIARLFNKDQILSGTPSPESGSGLGLYIAKQFMQLQNGDISVTSNPGQGSNFIFKIPLLEV